MKKNNVIISKKGKIPEDWIQYICKECGCEFSKPSWDYERANAHPGYGIRIIDFVQCPNCKRRIRWRAST